MLTNKSKLKPIDGKALAVEFYKSKLKPKVFCAQKNIPYHVLKYWRDRFKAQNCTSEAHGAKFLPVKVIPAQAELQRAPPLKIILGDRLIVEVPAGANLLQLKDVLEVCKTCG